MDDRQDINVGRLKIIIMAQALGLWPYHFIFYNRFDCYRSRGLSLKLKYRHALGHRPIAQLIITPVHEHFIDIQLISQAHDSHCYLFMNVRP